MLRNIIHTRHYIFAFILLLGSTGLCFAEDFTFNVPVALYNIPAQYVTAKVQCRCNLAASSNSKMGAYGQTIGYGERELPITNGTYVGTAVIKFNTLSGANPASAADWFCSLAFFDKTSNSWKAADRLMYNSYNRSKPYKTSDHGYLK